MKINPEHYFVLCTGHKIKTLEELSTLITNMDEKTFEYHVNDQKNDFENWIRFVFKSKLLAEAIADLRYKERHTIAMLIKKYLSECKILVVNAGSSSLKFQLLEMTSRDVLVKGMVDGINREPCVLTISAPSGTITKNIIVKNHEDAMQYVVESLTGDVIGDISEIAAVGHRVVHGGESYSKPVIITDEVINRLTELSSLAPLHNPSNVACIVACKKFLNVPHVAVFDTAFHSTIEKVKYLYGLPYEYYEKHKIRKYGFHGSSHKYITKLMTEYFKIEKKKHPKLIICHLGNGSSITAVKEGKSFNTTMGFTPVEGLIMGTRTGSLDPVISIHLGQHLNLTYAQLSDIFNKKSGLLGISGHSDMRDLHNSKDERCKLAIDMFCDRIVHYIGAYIAEMGGVDGIVFTAGIGENAFYVRKNILDHFKFLGLKLDDKKNNKNEFLITKLNSDIQAFVIATNEELEIATETKELLEL